jgi:hypothetical protein
MSLLKTEMTLPHTATYRYSLSLPETASNYWVWRQEVGGNFIALWSGEGKSGTIKYLKYDLKAGMPEKFF